MSPPSKGYNSNEVMVYIENLTERVGRHSAEMHKGFEKILAQLDLIKSSHAEEKLAVYQAINKVEKMAIEDNHRLSIKIALLTGAIGIASGGVGSFLMQLLRAP